MMKITRERKKYRISNPYCETKKLAAKEKTKELKKERGVDEVGFEDSCIEKNSAAEKFMRIYNQHLEHNEDLEKYKKEKENIQEKKRKTANRKKIKKLNFKLKKNNLLEKLVKNKAFIKANETVLASAKKRNNKDLSFINTPSNSKKFKEHFNNLEIEADMKSVATNNPKKKKKYIKHNIETKEDVLKEYDKIIYSSKYLQNPLEYAKNIVEDRKEKQKKKKKIAHFE
ncbi:conserved Plasmodium protein, unknown function [Plasmodium malariae]|uniref:Uncharacterized protein n=1 Tax=Plasmodium malariae TaxID=5858 RepID=A0A1A8VVQ4_PLAMA|nr:conserved Plasmodium protein, unknown function [Plasmodium malariae]SBS83772.1 conserved Plasmodium protein, unknown function [Plasmodium malariae]SBT87810.1 conserved Plasmodium protein, unknown function [Plasmodium malariae]